MQKSLACLAFLAVGAAACGGGGSTPVAAVTAHDEGGVQVVELQAAEGERWAATEVHAQAGRVRVNLVNQTSVPHDFQVQGITDATIGIARKGQTLSSTFTATPGRYSFVCTLHESTMKGVLVIG